jgi:hypothetical protein
MPRHHTLELACSVGSFCELQRYRPRLPSPLPYVADAAVLDEDSMAARRAASAPCVLRKSLRRRTGPPSQTRERPRGEGLVASLPPPPNRRRHCCPGRARSLIEPCSPGLCSAHDRDTWNRCPRTWSAAPGLPSGGCGNLECSLLFGGTPRLVMACLTDLARGDRQAGVRAEGSDRGLRPGVGVDGAAAAVLDGPSGWPFGAITGR